jgi:hypothetical protein
MSSATRLSRHCVQGKECPRQGFAHRLSSSSALSGALYGNIVQKCLRKEGKRALTKLLQAGTGHSWIGIHAGYQPALLGDIFSPQMLNV